MENLFKNFSKAALLLLFVIFAASCKKEKEKEPQPTARQNLTTVSQQGAGEITSITNGEGAKIMFSFEDFLAKDSSALERNNGGFKGRFKRFISNLPFNNGMINGKIATDTTDGFCFNCHLGTYTWNPQGNSGNGGWDYDNTVNPTKIVIKFPSDSNNTTVNDATLTISDYAQSLLVNSDTFGNHYYYNPTVLNANLTVGLTNPVEYAHIIATASWNNDGEPTALNLDVYVKPYTLLVNFVDNGTSITADASLTKDNEGVALLAVGGTVTFTDNTKEVVSTIDNGFVQYREVKLATSSAIDVATLEDIDLNTGITATDLNQYINIDVLFGAGFPKIAELFFEDDPMGEIIPYILFTDGTKDKAEVYFCPILTQACIEFEDDGADCTCP